MRSSSPSRPVRATLARSSTATRARNTAGSDAARPNHTGLVPACARAAGPPGVAPGRSRSMVPGAGQLAPAAWRSAGSRSAGGVPPGRSPPGTLVVTCGTGGSLAAADAGRAGTWPANATISTAAVPRAVVLIQRFTPIESSRRNGVPALGAGSQVVGLVGAAPAAVLLDGHAVRGADAGYVHAFTSVVGPDPDLRVVTPAEEVLQREDLVAGDAAAAGCQDEGRGVGGGEPRHLQTHAGHVARPELIEADADRCGEEELVGLATDALPLLHLGARGAAAVGVHVDALVGVVGDQPVPGGRVGGGRTGARGTHGAGPARHRRRIPRARRGERHQPHLTGSRPAVGHPEVGPAVAVEVTRHRLDRAAPPGVDAGVEPERRCGDAGTGGVGGEQPQLRLVHV